MAHVRVKPAALPGCPCLTARLSLFERMLCLPDRARLSVLSPVVADSPPARNPRNVLRYSLAAASAKAR